MNCDSVPRFPQHSDVFPLGLTIYPTHLNPYSSDGCWDLGCRRGCCDEHSVSWVGSLGQGESFISFPPLPQAQVHLR